MPQNFKYYLRGDLVQSIVSLFEKFKKCHFKNMGCGGVREKHLIIPLGRSTKNSISVQLSHLLKHCNATLLHVDAGESRRSQSNQFIPEFAMSQMDLYYW